MTEHDVFQLFNNTVNTPLLFATIIIITTLILEDLAITVSAVIASQSDIHVMVPLSALFTGIIAGDIGLYFMGRYGARIKYLHKYKQSPKIKTASALLDKNLITAILISRCIPGMRLPTYSLIGGLGIPFVKFVRVVLVAVSIWTTTLFYLFYQLGDLTQLLPPHLKWAITIGAISLFIAVQFLINARLSKNKRNKCNQKPIA